MVGELTPVLQETMKWKMYLLIASFCTISFVLVWFQFPETKGVRLEDMDELFGDQSVVPTPIVGPSASSGAVGIPMSFNIEPPLLEGSGYHRDDDSGSDDGEGSENESL